MRSHRYLRRGLSLAGDGLIVVWEDDGSRNALTEFFREREKNVANMTFLLVGEEEFWKARVFLELIWEYEDLKKQRDKASVDKLICGDCNSILARW